MSSSSRPLMECTICREEYDHLNHKPFVLKCSHSFCFSCLMRMVENNEKRCPLCRGQFQVSSLEDLAIHRSLLAFVNRNHERMLRPARIAFGEGSPYLREMYEANFLVFRINKKRIAELQKLNKTVTEDIMVKLKHVVSENNKMMQRLQRYNKEIGNVPKSVSEKQAGIRAAKDTSRNAESPTEYGRIMDVVNDMIKSQKHFVREMTSNLNKTLQERTTMEHSATRINIDLIQELLQGINLEEIEEGAQNYHFPELGAVAAGVSAHNYISAGDLKKTRQQVYAVKVIDGRRRFAKIVKSGQNPKTLYVHRLKDELHIPPTALLIEYEEMKKLTYYCDRLTFMDLRARGRPHVRIVIKYYSETNFLYHVKNHVLLCTGERGPTYANSKILEVMQKGKSNEFLVLGDFERNNGTAGRALVSRREGNEWWKNGGSWGMLSTFVGQHGSTETTASQFRILTQRCWASQIFAYVSEGLDQLRRYVQECDDVREIKISDCGRVIHC